MISKYTAKDSPCTTEVEKRLSDLERRVAVAMAELCPLPSDQSVFTKLSSRSPKDAKNRKVVKEQILLQLLKEKGRLQISKNEIIACVFQAHISSFKLHSAKEVLETLLSSERVITDELPLALEHRHKIWKEHIVLRKWNSIPLQYELRAFIYNNTMTALCQYYDEVVYPELVANKEIITRLVLDFFSKVKDDVPIHPKEYVLDLVVDIPQQKVIIVEINPFGKPDGMGTGTVMFDLRKNVDRGILFGEKGFEFRVETEMLSEEAYKNMIGPELDALVNQALSL